MSVHVLNKKLGNFFLTNQCNLAHHLGPVLLPVANAIKLLKVCIYRLVNTGLFLTSLVATCIVKFMMLMLVS